MDVCADDGDGDGFTNGDELGDPCCAWNEGDAGAAFTSDLAHPGYASSVPKHRPSFTLSGPPTAPTGAALTFVTDRSVSFSWTPPSSACEAAVSLQVAGGLTLTRATRGGDYTLCDAALVGLNGSAFTLSIAAVNRAGTSPPVSLTGTLAAAPGGPAIPCSPTQFNSTPVYMNTAGTRSATLATGVNPQLGMLWVIIIAAAFVAGGVALRLLTRDPHSKLKRLLVHDTMAGLPTHLPLQHLILSMVHDFAQSGRGYGLGLGAVLLALAVLWAQTNVWYASQVFSSGQGLSVWRASGYVLAAALGLQLLPVTRFSLWAVLFGVSFERAVKFHRWVGSIVLGLTALHGGGMIVGYAGTPIGWAYCFQVRKN